MFSAHCVKYLLDSATLSRPTNVTHNDASVVSLRVECGHTPCRFFFQYEENFDGNERGLSACQSQQLRFRLCCPPEGSGNYTLTWYTVEQLPVIAPEDYDRQFGEKTARELVRDHVLRLTYTAHDMAPFARDLGYDGPPFIWNEEERRHLRARLDALYFHLYGISREDAGYILSTFPIVRRQDEAAYGPLPHPRPHPRLHERSPTPATLRRKWQCRPTGTSILGSSSNEWVFQKQSSQGLCTLLDSCSSSCSSPTSRRRS